MTKISQLFRDAIAGNSDARQALFLRTDLVPELEDTLSEVFEQRPMIVLEPESYEADEIGVIRWSIVERTVARAVVDATSETTTVVGPEDKLAATRELREVLYAMVERLDQKIDAIHDELDAFESAAS